MKKENKAYRKTALICWGITFALTIYFRYVGNAFLTYLFGFLTLFFLTAASIFQARIRKIDNAEAEEANKKKK